MEPQRLAIKLNAAGERSVLQGHPWIFENSIEKINKVGRSGDIAIIFNKKDNAIIGIGLYDVASPIRIKMLHHGGGAPINERFFKSKIEKAYALRAPLLLTNTNSYRLLFGENDSFPGLIADVYDTVLVVKLYSEIWLPYLNEILDLLQKQLANKTTILRLSRSLQRSKMNDLQDGSVVYGELKNEVVQFVEHGVKFSANVVHGHKTGYFLDHRNNRKRVGELSNGKQVLDVFSYAGGFSVHALANNAKEVTSLDISKQALAIALDNGKLNAYTGVHKIIAGDAFVEMQNLINKKITYDIVVIDPPSFANSKDQIQIAKKKYRELADFGLKLTGTNGILVLASCSSRVSAQAFFDINKQALDASGRRYQIMEQTQHDIDHPISFPEGAYLKCGYYNLV